MAIVARFIGFLVVGVVGLAALASLVASAPDIVRYLKIRSM